MADLTDAQRASSWRYNVTLTTILFLIWFRVTDIVSGLLAGWLNQYTFPGFPLARLTAHCAAATGDPGSGDRCAVPKSGQAFKGDPLGRDLPATAH